MKVAAQLQSEGIERFPGRPWIIQSIHNCLRNVRYVDLPDGFSLQKVRKIETDDWEEQERLLGFPPAT